ncbi:MAG TPA: hypothetical protein DEX36_06085 [Glutamicibacter sp.]|nr:hypothetical protein [Glutamicibacter sp.]
MVMHQVNQHGNGLVHDHDGEDEGSGVAAPGDQVKRGHFQDVQLQRALEHHDGADLLDDHAEHGQSNRKPEIHQGIGSGFLHDRHVNLRWPAVGCNCCTL